jgi:hypothetical protein
VEAAFLLEVPRFELERLDFEEEERESMLDESLAILSYVSRDHELFVLEESVEQSLEEHGEANKHRF